MVLAKSCKLVPVMLMNVVLYRRKFAPHKYLVVALVTIGITSFMFFGKEKKGHKNSGGPTKAAVSAWGQLIGMGYLLANLLLDGVVNSTQDQIFQTFKPTGQQMMLHINLFSTLISTVLSVLPLPHIPIVHPTAAGELELVYAIEFLKTHPDALKALAQFAITGALGQLFIFETLQHFGSLTLVYVRNPLLLLVHLHPPWSLFSSTITLTRKLFTMLLSVVVYNHKLTAGQWIGTGIVFAGISVEAWVKRTGEGTPGRRLPCVEETHYSFQRSTQNALGRRRKRQRSRNFNWTSGSSLGRYFAVIHIVIYPFPSTHNTSSIWLPDVSATDGNPRDDEESLHVSGSMTRGLNVLCSRERAKEHPWIVKQKTDKNRVNQKELARKLIGGMVGNKTTKH